MTAIEHTCMMETTGLLTTLPRWKEMEEETVSVGTVKKAYGRGQSYKQMGLHGKDLQEKQDGMSK